MQLSFDTLARYLPHQLLQEALHTPATNQAYVIEKEAVILFADISGFTPLAEAMAVQGAEGTERLSEALNDYFGQMIDVIHASKGEIITFAGDALTAFWPRAADAETITTSAAMTIQRELSGYQTPDGFPLAVRLGIGMGSIHFVSVGGEGERRAYFLSGTALQQATRAERQARPGQVVVSSGIWDAIAAQSEGHKVKDDCYRIDTFAAEKSPPTPSLAQAQPKALLPQLAAHVPKTVVERLGAGQGGWLAELRWLSIVFVHLPTLHHETPLAEMQDLTLRLQRIIIEYEGSINKISVDDKGCTLLAAFGLPPLAHEDDAVRVSQAALDIHKSLRAQALPTAIGIATGRAFCGVIGNQKRCEYTVIGDVVNLAARLMQQAYDPQLPDILCNRRTFKSARERMDFLTLPPLVLKGKATPQSAYSPLQSKEREPQPQAPMVGRDSERKAFADALAKVVEGERRCLLLEGEAGLGKSRLLGSWVEHAHAQGQSTWLGAADAIEQASSYFAWKPIFQRCFGLLTPQNSHTAIPPIPFATLNPAQEAIVWQKCRQWLPDSEHLWPLLKSVLPLTIEETELTSQLVGQARAESTNALLVEVLTKASSAQPLILILEDAHWFDSASRQLALQVYRTLPSLLMVIATRPLPPPLPVAHSALQQLPFVEYITLTNLSKDQINTLLEYRLQVSSIPRALLGFVYQKAEGHPFFSEEILHTLREEGIIHIEGERCELTGKLDDIDFPETIEGVIMSRIDKLSPPHQFALKVASVIGRIFTYRMFYDIHPISNDKPYLHEYLQSIEKLDITQKETDVPHLAYVFKHIITQQVAYQLFAYAPRRQLHRAIGVWLEAQEENIDAALLAHHWALAIPPESGSFERTKTIDYLERAGTQALQQGSYQEAISLLQDAIKHHSTPTTSMSIDPPQTLRVGRWHRRLGEAYLGLGEHKESQRHIEQAISYLDMPFPRSRASLIVATLPQMLRSIWLLLRPSHWRLPPAERYTERQEASQAHSLHFNLSYFAAEVVPLAYSTFRRFQLSSQLGPSPELAQSYSEFAGFVSSIPLHTLGRKLHVHAIAMARSLNDLTTTGRVCLVKAHFDVGLGDWASAEAYCREGLAAVEQLGAHRQIIELLAFLGVIVRFQGKYKECFTYQDRIFRAAQNNHNAQGQLWGLLGSCQSLFALGDLDEVEEILTKALPLVGQSGGFAETLWYAQNRALFEVYNHRWEDAREWADKARMTIKGKLPTALYLYKGYANVVEVYITLWKQHEDPRSPHAKSLLKAAQDASKTLAKFAQIFPVGQALSQLWKGHLASCQGKTRRAIKYWKQSIATAQAQQMPYEQACALQAWAKILSPTDPMHAQMQSKANTLLTQCGVVSNNAE